jgi:alkylhydroperoxidase/carboxymuconolactone decarboxylase family protein YurZ
MPEHPLAAMMKLDPTLTGHLKMTEDLVYADGALPRKYKLLLAMAFDAAHGTANGVRALAGQAIQAGATKEEIAETLRVAYHLTGVGSVYVASQGLKEIIL